MKVCSRCKVERELSEFHKNKSRKDGFEHRCKKCRKEISLNRYKRDKVKILSKNKEWSKNNKDKIKKKAAERYEKNRDKILKQSKEYYDNNKEKVLKRHSEWRDSNPKYYEKYNEENKYDLNKKAVERRKRKNDEYKKMEARWREKNREKIKKYANEWRLKKRNNDPVFALETKVRCLVLYSFRKNKLIKSKSLECILGCNNVAFIKYLNNNKYGFNSSMNNVDLDHIIPVSLATNEADVIKMNHHTNFQLLPSNYNRFIKRNNKWDRSHFEKWLKENPNPEDWG